MDSSSSSITNNSKSQRIQQRKEKYVPDALQPLAPNYINKGEGAVVEDVDGNNLIDLSGGWGCLAVGYSHPTVIQAVKDQAERFFHTDYTAIPYEAFVDLAQRLSTLAPGTSPKKTAFFNSGAEAVENAVKIARVHTGRDGVVVFEKAFHGRTLMTMTMTHKAQPYKNGFGPFASEVYRLSYPDPYRNPLAMEELEKELKNMVDPEEVAAMVIEPVLGEGGFIVPPAQLLPYLRELTDKYGIDLIFDEIQSGMGRTGKLFACEHWDVEPDMVTVAKSLAAGLPLSGVIGKADVMDSPPPSSIGGTFVGNPVACEAALAVLDVIEEENLLDRAEKIGEIVLPRFKEWAQRFSEIGDVRGLGAMDAMELVEDQQSKQPASQLADRLVELALERGVVLPTAGLDGNVIRLLTPLVIEEDHLNHGLDIIEESLQMALEG